MEWALLYVPTGEGLPRNPTRRWREAFFEAPCGGTAVHLCFRESFEQLLAGELPAELLKAQRLQLNINVRRIEFSDDEVVDVYRQALDLGPDLILQYHSVTVLPIQRFLAGLSAADAPRVHVLLDESRGTGVAPAAWAPPAQLSGRYCGFAGGLGPSSVAQVLAQVETLARPYWIDMETGIRTDNQFDLEKARAVLEAAQRHLRSEFTLAATS